jgi:hypothetical protein
MLGSSGRAFGALRTSSCPVNCYCTALTPHLPSNPSVLRSAGTGCGSCLLEIDVLWLQVFLIAVTMCLLGRPLMAVIFLSQGGGKL